LAVLAAQVWRGGISAVADRKRHQRKRASGSKAAFDGCWRFPSAMTYLAGGARPAHRRRPGGRVDSFSLFGL